MAEITKEPKRRGRPPKTVLEQNSNTGKVKASPATKKKTSAQITKTEALAAKTAEKPSTKAKTTRVTKPSASKTGKKLGAKKAQTVLPENMPTIGVVSLGCDKNRVDTENMLTYLKGAGYQFTSDPAKADAIIVNTCCFIRSARTESEDTIAEMAEYKKKGKCKKLIVTGCLPQYDIKSLKNDFPEVDALLGINEYKNIVKIVDDLFKIGKKIRLNTSPMCLDAVRNRITTTPHYLAYLKIADGCNNFCSFCTIPYIRGRYRSRDMESLVEEAKELAEKGVKELILVAQDTTRYGIDLYGEPKLVELVKELSKIEGLVWIRLLYCYPEMVSDALIQEIASNPKVCNYIDVPLQHVATPVLKRMNRHCTYEQTVELTHKLKSTGKFMAVRTTYMVGFPGETKKDFKQLYQFIKNNHLTNVGFFAYSKEAGTQAAEMENQIPESVKNKRLIKLVKLQKRIHSRLAEKNHVGKVYEVLCEGFDEARKLYVGRSEYQAPEIDTNIYFSSLEPVVLGEMYKVKIKKLVGYDLEGVRV